MSSEPWRTAPGYVQQETLAQNAVRAWADGAKVALPQGKSYSAIARAAHDLAAGVEQGLWTLGDVYRLTQQKRVQNPERDAAYGLRVIAQDLPAWKAAHPHYRGSEEFIPMPPGALEQCYTRQDGTYKTWDFERGCFVEGHSVEPKSEPREEAYYPHRHPFKGAPGLRRTLVTPPGGTPHLDYFFVYDAQKEALALLEEEYFDLLVLGQDDPKEES